VVSLSLDFETRSHVDLRKAGVYRYAEDASTDIWCMAFMFDGDEEPSIWLPPQYMQRPSAHLCADTQRIFDHVRAGGEIRAWNAQFERVIWREILGPRYGFPVPRLEQWHDTAAEAAAMALPRQLKKAAQVLNSSVQIADDKHSLILQLSKPRTPTKKNPAVWWDTPEKLEQLYAACKQDVRAEHAIAKRIRRLVPFEREVYLADQRCNDRGVGIDLPLVEAAQTIAAQAMEEANTDIAEMTGGQVTSVTQREKLQVWLTGQGVELDNLQKNTLRDLVKDGELDLLHQQVVELRLQTAKSSTAKLTAMQKCVCADGRARGLHLYHGAATGRDAGKLIQVQNFPKPYDPQSGLPRIRNIEQFIPLVLNGEYDLIDIHHPPLLMLAVLLRSMLRAAPGHRFIAEDFAQIEARVLAWIAEQNDLVEAFALGHKIYEPMAADIYDVPASEITKEDPRREVGKVTILGSGFQMGWVTFQKQTYKNTGVWLEDDIAEKAITAYRARNDKIVQFWYDIERTAKRAVMRAGETMRVGRGGALAFVQRGKFLWCVLPSGRSLAYALPRIETRRTPWGQDKQVVTFAGVDGVTKQWFRFAAYGGLWTENVVQAMARDLLMSAMLRVEKRGYPVVLRVHDELVCEVPDGFGSEQELRQLMMVRPRWASDLPVAAEGWEGERYRK
jgi:DNA polymerase